MRKEELLRQKREIIDETANGIRHHLSIVMDDEKLKLFSKNQLNVITEIVEAVMNQEEKRNPFATLSAKEVMHKETGKILAIDEDGNVYNESEAEILSSAAANIYKKIKEQI